MQSLKLPDTKDNTKADRLARSCETAFRLILVLLAVMGIIKRNIIIMHQGTLLYHSLMTLASCFIPDLIKKTTKLYITAGFRFMFLVFIIMAQFLGEIADFFMKFAWWDKMVHVYSAFIITIIGYIIAIMSGYDKKGERSISALPVSLFAFSFSMMFGAMWEIFEYLMDVSFGMNMQKSGLVDTMEDLIVCLFSSIILCTIYIHDVKNNKNSLLIKTLDRFILLNIRSK